MRLAGFTLVEIMVATLLAVLAVASAAGVVARGRGTYRSVESQARMEETARAALDLLGAEIHMAGYLGLAPPGTPVAGSTAVGNDAPAGLGADGGCVASLALDFAAPVAGADGALAASQGVPLGCRASPQGRSIAGTDTLVLRHASAIAARPEAGRLQIESTRRSARLLADGTTVLESAGRLHDVETSAFYVSADSTGLAGRPSLRRKRLVGGAAPSFQDEELVTGVEDLQVEAAVQSDDASGVADRHVPLDHIGADARPRALRVWVLVRSDVADPAPVALPALAYANRDLPPESSRYRRLLASRSFELRNAGPSS